MNINEYVIGEYSISDGMKSVLLIGEYSISDGMKSVLFHVSIKWWGAFIIVYLRTI